MANLESYSNLTRLQEDLIKKGFSFGQLFALSIYAKSPNNVNFKSSYKQLLNTDHQPTNQSSSYLNYKTSELSIKQEFQTSKVYKTTFEFTPKQQKDLKGKVEIEFNKEENVSKQTASVEYTQEKFKAKAALTESLALKFSTVAGSKGLGIGLDLALELRSLKLSGYNGALWWFTNDYRLVFKHISTNKKKHSFRKLSRIFVLQSEAKSQNRRSSDIRPYKKT